MKCLVNGEEIVVRNDEEFPLEKAAKLYAMRNYSPSDKGKMKAFADPILRRCGGQVVFYRVTLKRKIPASKEMRIVETVCVMVSHCISPAQHKGLP